MERKKKYPKRIKQEYAGKAGWSRFVFPEMDGYLLGCCDCGLVHEMEFQVHFVGRKLRGNAFEAKLIDNKNFRVAFRARRYPRKK